MPWLLASAYLLAATPILFAAANDVNAAVPAATMIAAVPAADKMMMIAAAPAADEMITVTADDKLEDAPEQSHQPT